MRFGSTKLHLLVVASLVLAGASSLALATGNVVISQVWGKGNSVAANLPQASYVELFNRTASPIDMTGWSVQVATASGTSWLSLSFDLNTTIQPYSYFLVQTSAGSLNILPDAVFSPTNGVLGATGGPVGNRVALRNSQVVLTVADPNGDPTIVDLVGFGSSAAAYETARAPALVTSASGGAPTRNAGGCVDTDNNSTDFSLLPPSPRNSSSPAIVCGPSGACCDPLTGLCSVDAAAHCTSIGRTYIADGAACSPSPCAPLGRCCTVLAGLCYTVTQAGCTTVNGSIWTAGTTCSASPQVCGFTDFPITTTACCFPDGTCCQIDERVVMCVAMGGTIPAAGGAACNPTAGFVCSSSPPANDVCSGAVTLSLGVPAVGHSGRALANDFCQNLCNNSSYSTHGVWFKFTPAASGQYDVSSCGSLFDTELQVLQVMGSCGNPATWSYVACMLDGCSAGFPETGACGSAGLAVNAKLSGVRMAAGQTYHILLTGPGSSSGQGQSGNYKATVTLTSAAAFGACCNTVTGQCELRSPTGCAVSVPTSVYQGDGSTCDPFLCDIGAGACCNFGGCTLRTPSFCQSIAGTFTGGACLPSPCVTGACCAQTGSCLASISFSQCYNNNGIYQGDGVTCTGITCASPGACCYPSGACSFLTETACLFPTAQLSTVGVFQGVGITCSPGLCPQPGVCCRGATCNATISQGSCTTDVGSLAGATFSTAGTTCGASATTPCCHADYNKAGGISVQDIFDFLNDWFAGRPYANTGGDGTSSALSVQNIFDFLNVWFAGGCT